MLALILSTHRGGLTPAVNKDDGPGMYHISSWYESFHVHLTYHDSVPAPSPIIHGLAPNVEVGSSMCAFHGVTVDVTEDELSREAS